MAVPTTDPATARPYLEQVERLRDALPGAGLGWLDALRAEAAGRFAAAGLPTLRNESWRSTNLAPLTRIAFQPAGGGAIAAFDLLPTVRPAGNNPTRLVFVDGQFRPELSTTAGVPAGVDLNGLTDRYRDDTAWLEANLGRVADTSAHPFVALNTAHLADGAVLRIGRGVEVAEPIELVYVSLGREDAATAFHPRLLIVAEPLSRALVVEHHVGLGSGVTLANHVTETTVGEGATLHHYKVQRETASAFHIAHAAVRVAKDATYDSFILTAGARLARNEVWARLDGTGATCHLNGAYMADGERHVDTTTFIDHALPHGTSREVYKGVIDERARAVFQGKILVRPGAQKTDGHQLNRALLLSETAQIDAKPELEIYADDVKCSHGATAGELADDQLFYMRARGLDRETARGLLIGAFLAEALEEIPEESVREAFQGVVASWQAAR